MSTRRMSPGLSLFGLLIPALAAAADFPRFEAQEIDPHAQIADYRHAITFARSLDEVDGDRIGVWGSSYSGAHVLVVGAIDRRVKCVVAQVPLISGHENARRLIRSDLIAPTQAMFEADREARYRGEAPAMIPVVAPEGVPCALPTADSYEWFTTSGAERAPSRSSRRRPMSSSSRVVMPGSSASPMAFKVRATTRPATLSFSSSSSLPMVMLRAPFEGASSDDSRPLDFTDDGSLRAWASQGRGAPAARP